MLVIEFGDDSFGMARIIKTTINKACNQYYTMKKLYFENNNINNTNQSQETP